MLTCGQLLRPTSAAPGAHHYCGGPTLNRTSGAGSEGTESPLVPACGVTGGGAEPPPWVWFCRTNAGRRVFFRTAGEQRQGAQRERNAKADW